MPDPTLRLKYYQETGQTELAKKYEQYLRETGQMQEERRATVRGAMTDATSALQRERPDASGDFEATAPAVLGSVSSLLRDVPGGEAVQSGVRALVRGQSYRDARNDIRGAEDQAPAMARIPARLAGGGLAAMVLPGSAAAQGAKFGLLSGALDSNPDAGLGSRAIGGVVQGALGGTLGGAGMAVNALRKAPAGTIKAVASAAMPRNVGRAVRAARTLRDATRSLPVAEVTPQTEGFIGNSIRNLADAGTAEAATITPRRIPSLDESLERIIAPVEKPNVTEGFVGNSMDNLAEVARAPEPSVPAAVRPAEAPSGPVMQAIKRAPTRHRTQAQFNHLAERMGTAKAPEQSMDAQLSALIKKARAQSPPGEALGNQIGDAELAMGAGAEPQNLEALLAESLKHVKKGGSLNTARGASPKPSVGETLADSAIVRFAREIPSGSSPVQSIKVHDDGRTYLFTSPMGDQLAVSKGRFPTLAAARTYAERMLLQDLEPLEAAKNLSGSLPRRP